MIRYVLEIMCHDSRIEGIVEASNEVSRNELCPLLLAEKQFSIRDNETENIWWNVITSDVEYITILETIEIGDEGDDS